VPYKIYASLKQDMNEGWVWVTNPTINNRCIVRISNRDTNKTVYCEAMSIDHNYREAYKNGWTETINPGESVITMNQWYRNKLGIDSTGSYASLMVSPETHLLARFRSCIDHPQVVVRLATWLGLVSVVLGIIGVAK